MPLPHLSRPLVYTHLSLIRSPVPVRIPIEDDLVGPGVPNLDRRVRQCAVGAPLDRVARTFRDVEGLAAALVSLAVDALLDRVV